MKTDPSPRDLKRRKYTEEDRILMSIRYLFTTVKVYKTEYVNKEGKKVVYENIQVYKGKEHRELTKEEIEFIRSHSAYEIAKHFNKSTSWAYSRMLGNSYTI